MLGACLAPLFLAGLVGLFVVWMTRRPLRFWQIVLGVLLIFAGFGLGLNGDSFARKTLFGMNFSSYRLFVAYTLRNPPKTQKGERRKLPDKPGLGVYETYYETVAGKPIITINTDCGPTLESVLFSTAPNTSHDDGKLTLMKQDDLGFWYFVISP